MPIIQVDFYTENGKWKYGGEVNIDVASYGSNVLQDIIKKQKIITCCKDYYIVVTDLSESQNDRNYQMFYQRLYTVEQVNKMVAIINFN